MYAKLFASIYDGTLGTRGPWQALVTFQQLLILADRFGVVDMTLEVIARRTLIPLEVLTTGIGELIQPDPLSRRSDEDGRRIVPIDPTRTWGWRIVNYGHYRKLRNADERRGYQAAYMREYRAGRRRTGGGRPATAEADASPIVAELPLRGGGVFAFRETWLATLDPLYPLVNIRDSVLAMRAWLEGNPDRRKTGRGIKRFITGWLAREQAEYVAQDQRQQR